MSVRLGRSEYNGAGIHPSEADVADRLAVEMAGTRRQPAWPGKAVGVGQEGSSGRRRAVGRCR